MHIIYMLTILYTAHCLVYTDIVRKPRCYAAGVIDKVKIMKAFMHA